MTVSSAEESSSTAEQGSNHNIEANHSGQFLNPAKVGRRANRPRRNSRSSLFEAERREGIVRLPPRPILVDYEKPLYDVFKNFVELVIMRPRSLDVT
jgi:hypothetical protein